MDYLAFANIYGAMRVAMWVVNEVAIQVAVKSTKDYISWLKKLKCLHSVAAIHLVGRWVIHYEHRVLVDFDVPKLCQELHPKLVC